MINIAKSGISGSEASSPRQNENAYPRTALVVDDEPVIRELLSMMLIAKGCKVWTAENGIQALTLATDSSREPFDLLITDVCMPGMNGVDLAMALREIQPTINVIFASGYSVDEITAMGLEIGGLPLIGKPFKMSAIEEVLTALSAGEAVTC